MIGSNDLTSAQQMHALCETPEGRPIRAEAAGKIAILIVGMHRSGTSMTTRVLNILGCDIAASLLEADQFNQRGYWESPDIAALNDEILSSAGMSWDDWGHFCPDWYASPKKPLFEVKALELLQDLFAGKHFFLMKDPRFCLLLPFWLEVLEKSGVSPRIVLPWRDPVEVAASLLRRNGMNPSIAQVLWLRHVLEAEHASRGLPRAFLRYGDLTRDWHSAVRGIAMSIGVSWPRVSTSSQIEIDTFLSADLRHHDAAAQNTLNHATSIKASWLEEAVAILETGAATGEEHRRLDAIRQKFDRATELFGRPVAEMTQFGRRLKTTLSETEAELASSREECSQREEKLHNAQRVLAAEVEQLRNDLKTGQEREAALNSELQSGQQALRENLNAMQTMFSEATRLVQVSNDELDASREREAALEAELNASQEREAAFGAELDATQRELATTRQELSASRNALQAIETSRIWRATAGYRGLRGRIGRRSAPRES